MGYHGSLVMGGVVALPSGSSGSDGGYKGIADVTCRRFIHVGMNGQRKDAVGQLVGDR